MTPDGDRRGRYSGDRRERGTAARPGVRRIGDCRLRHRDRRGERGTGLIANDGTATARLRHHRPRNGGRQAARRRWVVGEAGIDGIKADTPYRCENGRLVEVDR